MNLFGFLTLFLSFIVFLIVIGIPPLMSYHSGIWSYTLILLFLLPRYGFVLSTATLVDSHLLVLVLNLLLISIPLYFFKLFWNFVVHFLSFFYLPVFFFHLLFLFFFIFFIFFFLCYHFVSFFVILYYPLGEGNLIFCCTDLTNPNLWQIKIIILISHTNVSFFATSISFNMIFFF